jgi:hypothetical protein
MVFVVVLEPPRKLSQNRLCIRAIVNVNIIQLNVFSMTHRFLHRSGGLSIRHSRGFHAEGLVRPSGVVEADPFTDDT